MPTARIALPVPADPDQVPGAWTVVSSLRPDRKFIVASPTGANIAANNIFKIQSDILGGGEPSDVAQFEATFTNNNYRTPADNVINDAGVRYRVVRVSGSDLVVMSVVADVSCDCPEAEPAGPFPGFGLVGSISAIDIGDAASVGVTLLAAQIDHQHAFVGGAAPPAVAAASDAGVATTPARSDHTHAAPQWRSGRATLEAGGLVVVPQADVIGASDIVVTVAQAITSVLTARYVVDPANHVVGVSFTIQAEQAAPGAANADDRSVMTWVMSVS